MKERIVTALFGGIIFFLLLWLGGWWYSSFVIALATVGYFEYCFMIKTRPASVQGLIGLFLVWMLLLNGVFQYTEIDRHEIFAGSNMILAGLVFFLILMVVTRNQVTMEEVAYLILGSLYIGFGFSFMLQTRMGLEGLTWSLWIVVVTFANDSGAYFIGRKWGKRKMWPSISPNKTVGGAFGGLLCAVIVGGFFSWWNSSLGDMPMMFVLALLVGVAGQIGDLVESAMKRSLKVKDSGKLLPGHGGVLDRFDSFLLIFPLLHLIQLL